MQSRYTTGLLTGVTLSLGVSAPIAWWLLASLASTKRRACRDPLTGLANRAAAEDLHLRATATGRMMTLMLLDLDKFKNVNDTYGHDAGDRLIQVIAARLATQARALGGLAARLAGDEFVVIIPAGGACEHRRQADALQNSVAAQVVVPGHYERHTITPSATIGMAIPRDGQDSWSSLLKAADIALYSEKRTQERDVPVGPGFQSVAQMVPA
jgi:diguanylate cyclase (GGDEF)-like protein